jgi:hypothetical protein
VRYRRRRPADAESHHGPSRARDDRLCHRFQARNNVVQHEQDFVEDALPLVDGQIERAAKEAHVAAGGEVLAGACQKHTANRGAALRDDDRVTKVTCGFQVDRIENVGTIEPDGRDVPLLGIVDTLAHGCFSIPQGFSGREHVFDALPRCRPVSEAQHSLALQGQDFALRHRLQSVGSAPAEDGGKRFGDC